MNIFVLDKNPIRAAKMACDKHVVKMILESAQMLCSVQPEGTAPYKRSFYNHPCTKWVRTSDANYDWLIEHGLALCREYTCRYLKHHKSEKVIKWCDENRPQLPYIGLTPHPTCMPDRYKVECAIESYRNYYNGEKAYFAKWKNVDTPTWFTGVFQ